jgi:N-acetylglucosaminyl-diphospho-decaprenol L-rhamnosyltransferase
VNSADLTLSVVSHGQAELIHKLLSDLDALPGIAGVHVVLTLNIPEQEPRWQDHTRLRIHVIRNTAPQGFGHNHNAAFAHCRTRYFTVLNPDLRFPSDPFPRLLQALHDAPGAALAAPRVLNSAGGDEDSVREMLTPWNLLRRRLSVMRPSRDVVAQRPGFWVAGMFLLFVAEDYRRLGGFDQRFFMYCEDFELCLRVHLARRGILVVPDASVVHDARRDSHRSLRHLRWHLASLLRVWVSASFLRVVFGIR